jgi:hypothetical protein
MKKLTFLCFFFLPFLIKAQIGNYEEVVYLKNGSVIRGVIVEQIPGKSLKIKSGDNIFAFTIEEVEKFTKEPLLRQKPQFYNPVEKNERDRQDPLRHAVDRAEFNKRYKPQGVYLLLGLGGGASQIGAGLGAELTLGGKIFNKKDWKRRSKVGGDIWGFAGVQGLPFNGGNFQFGLNAGPTIARRVRTNGYFYVTPYIGFNAVLAQERDLYRGPNNSFHRNVLNAGIAAPIGLKLEFTYKKFYVGNNIAIGGMASTDGFGGYFRTSINLGVKF